MKRSKSFLIGALCAIVVALAGCASTPTQNQQVGAAVLIDAAVGYAVQNGTSDATVWAERAVKIVSIAHALQAVASDQTVTLVSLTAALNPLLDQAKLKPAERLAANTLVATLSQLIEQKKDQTSPTVITIQLVLKDVVDAASVYLPPVKT